MIQEFNLPHLGLGVNNLVTLYTEAYPALYFRKKEYEDDDNDWLHDIDFSLKITNCEVE